MKILIIEDNEANLYGLICYVKASWKSSDIPLEVVGVKNLTDGILEAANGDVSVVLLDLDLPDSDLTNTIHNIKRFRPAHVHVMTGHSNEDIIASCMIHGADHVFIKGTVIGLIPKIFESMQKDFLRRVVEESPKTNGLSK